MNELRNFYRYAEQNIEDRTGALVLVDMIQERCEVSRVRALRKVVELRRPVKEARTMALATRFTRAGSRAFVLMQTRLRLLVGLPVYSPFTLVLVLNNTPPILRAGLPVEEAPFWAPHVITVGARWVLSFLATQKQYPLSKMQREILAKWIR